MDGQTALRFDLFCPELRKKKKGTIIHSENDEAMGDGQYYRYHYLISFMNRLS